MLTVLAYIGVSQARRTALATLEKSIPPAVPIQAIIDTGASGVCIDTTVLARLDLSPTGSTQVHTPTTGAEPARINTFDVILMIPGIPGHSPMVHQIIEVMESNLSAMQGFHALIGMSVLRACLLTLDGQTGLFSLAY